MRSIDTFNNAKIGDIFVSKGKGLFSKIVCLVLKSAYSHTFIKATPSTIIEANDIGVMEVNASKFLRSCKTITHLGFPAGESTRILFVSNVRFLLGKPYDWGILLGGLWSRMWHRSRRLPGLLDNANSYTCSEVIATALTRSGFNLPFPPSQMTPEDLYYYMKGTMEAGTC